MVSLTNQTLLRRITLKAQAAELDHDLIRTKGRHNVAPQGRTSKIEIHSWEEIDHLPMVGRQMRERKLFP